MPPRSQARSPENDPAALLGDELRELRKLAGYRSQDEVAGLIGTDRSVIGKAETGELPPTPEVLEALLDTYEVTERLRRLYERLNVVARNRHDPAKLQVAPWYETEARAHTLRYWAPIIVPGIVQIPAYATGLFKAMRLDEATIAEGLASRMSRQTIFERPDPPDISIVLWEPVLTHQIGTDETMRDQLARLVELSDMPTVTIQVLPSSQGGSPGLGGAIQLAATADTPELLASDGLLENQLTNVPEVVRRASSIFNCVRADSLNRADSRDILVEAMKRCSN